MNLSCVLAVAVLAGLLIWAGCGLRRLRSALCQEREENRRLRELVRAGAREAEAELEQMRRLRHDLRHFLQMAEGGAPLGSLLSVLETAQEQPASARDGSWAVSSLVRGYQSLAEDEGFSVDFRLEHLPVSEGQLPDVCLVLSNLLHFGGNRMDESIINYMKRNFNLVIGKKTAMQLKENIGSAMPGAEGTMTIVGLDVVSGLPIQMEVTAETVYNAIKENMNSLCNAIKMILERVPPELAKDIIASGIYLTGGGSEIDRLDILFKELTNIKVNTCEDADECVARGLSQVIKDAKFKHLAYSMRTKVFK